MVKESDAPEQDYTYKLQPGVKGEIVINAGIYKGHYPSRVEDLKGDTAGFTNPLIGGILLPAYRDLSFNFVMDDGNALYIFEMSVKRVENQQGLPIMWSHLTSYPKRIQRRQFLRVSCSWDVMVFHMGQEIREPMSAKWTPAKAIDISLGGYRFSLPYQEAGGLAFEMNEKVLVFFTLSEKQYILPGKTSRIVRTEEAWEVGVGFDSLSSKMEKKLFEYIRQQEIIWRDE